MLNILTNMISKLPGIYCILNKSTGKFYIGSAIDVNIRIRTHTSQLISNKHHSILLQRAFNKYGIDDFEYVVLEYVKDKTFLLDREQFWLDLTQCFVPNLGYNLSPTAGSLLGFKYSDKGKANVKAAMTAERKAVLSAYFKGKKCGPRSEEVKEKIRKTMIGQKYSENRKLKISKQVKDNWENRRVSDVLNLNLGSELNVRF